MHSILLHQLYFLYILFKSKERDFVRKSYLDTKHISANFYSNGEWWLVLYRLDTEPLDDVDFFFVGWQKSHGLEL